MSSILGNIPIVGNILGGGNNNNSGGLLGGLLGGGGGGGLLGGLFDMTGIPQLIEEGVLLYLGVMIVMKLIDKM